eukprot:31476-Pelagococcus_subviridis.AAC.24
MEEMTFETPRTVLYAGASVASRAASSFFSLVVVAFSLVAYPPPPSRRSRRQGRDRHEALVALGERQLLPPERQHLAPEVQAKDERVDPHGHGEDALGRVAREGLAPVGDSARRPGNGAPHLIDRDDA